MLQFFLQMIQERQDHRIFRYPKLLKHDDIALFAQDGLHQTLLDRLLAKGAPTEMQIIAQDLDGLRSLHDRP
jgi:hypothetical protein